MRALAHTHPCSLLEVGSKDILLLGLTLQIGVVNLTRCSHE